MTFYQLSLLIKELEKKSIRRELIEPVWEFLKRLPPEEIEIGVRFILGKAWREGRGGVGERLVKNILKELLPPEEREKLIRVGDLGDQVEELWQTHHPHPPSPLRLKDVAEELERLSRMKGKGIREKKKRVITSLLLRLSPPEARLFIKILIGEMRHGLKKGVFLWGISLKTGKEVKELERILLEGKRIEELVREALEGRSIQTLSPLFRPFPPMLAENAPTLKDAFDYVKGKVALEFKLDGVRIQVHRRGREIRIYSRRGRDITPYFPEISAILPPSDTSLILDGEVIGVSSSGKPLPFQDLMRRFRKEKDREYIPVRFYFFDLLLQGSRRLFSLPYEERRKLLETLLPSSLIIPQIVVDSVEKGERFYLKALKEGHEGVMVKYLDSEYLPGKREGGWYKVKKIFTLDLVILGAEWGHGRRKNWLSDYYLGIKDRGRFFCVGKTFKGLKDQEFEELTQKLLNLKVKEEGNIIWVKPRVVVEVVFNEVQKSSRYPGGYTLRFARIHRIREDKELSEVDDLLTLKKIYENQFQSREKIKDKPQLELFTQEE